MLMILDVVEVQNPKLLNNTPFICHHPFAKVPTKKREPQIVSSAKTLPSTPGACAPCNLACRGKDLKALCEKEPWKRCQIELRKPRWYTLQIQRKTQSKCCFLVIHIWLVVSTPLNNISQWEGLSHILWNIQNIPNHQSDLISLYTWVNVDSYEQLPSHRLSRCCLLWYPRFTYPMLMGFGWNLNCPNFPGRCFFVANLGCFSKDQDSYVLPSSKLT
jgi:hypothetical protein